MSMKKIIEKILSDKGWTAYRLAKELNTNLQGIDYVLKSGTRGMRLSTLCKLRKISGMSWSAFGKQLDVEFLEDEGKD